MSHPTEGCWIKFGPIQQQIQHQGPYHPANPYRTVTAKWQVPLYSTQANYDGLGTSVAARYADLGAQGIVYQPLHFYSSIPEMAAVVDGYDTGFSERLQLLEESLYVSNP